MTTGSDSRRGDRRRAWVLARTELRALGRRLTASRRRAAGFGIGVLQFAVVFPLFVYGPATSLGRALAAGEPRLGTLGMLSSLTAVAGLYMGGATIINQNRIGDIGALVRTSMAPRAVALGRLTSELVQTMLLLVVPMAVGLVEVGIGAGGPAVPLLLGVALAGTMLAGVFVGRSLGAVLRYVGALSRLSTWSKILVAGVIFVAVFAGSQVLIFSVLPGDGPFGQSVAVPALFPGTPVQAYAATMLAPLGLPVRPLGVVAVGAVLVATGVGLLVTVRIETAMLLWDEAEDASGESSTREIPQPLDRWRASRIGWRHLVGTVRDPKTLAHTFPLFAGLIPGLVFLVTDPEILLTVGPPMLVTFGAALAGTTFCLNPLGDDRDQLPLVLTSATSTAPLLRGRIAAGSVIGLGLAAVGLPLGLVGPEPLSTLAAVATAPAAVPAAAGVALGIGAFSPQFERREYVNVERAHPSQLVLFGYLFAGGVVFGGGVFGFWLAVGAVSAGNLAPVWAGVVAVLALVVWSVLGAIGYRYAVGRFDDLSLDDV